MESAKPDHKIVLIGMMGSGKSSAGRRVARALNLGFVDLDQRIEERSGRSIREIFATGGEEEFRDLEREELRRSLEEPGSAVIAAGGGIVVLEGTRRLLGEAQEVIWLRADIDVLVERVAARRGRDHRPLIDGDPRARLAALMVERDDLYREAATSVVEVDGCSLDEVVERIEAVLRPLSSSVDSGTAES